MNLAILIYTKNSAQKHKANDRHNRTTVFAAVAYGCDCFFHALTSTFNSHIAQPKIEVNEKEEPDQSKRVDCFVFSGGNVPIKVPIKSWHSHCDKHKQTNEVHKHIGNGAASGLEAEC